MLIATVRTHWRGPCETFSSIASDGVRMGDPACYRDYCPACDAQVTITDGECPECGASLGQHGE